MADPKIPDGEHGLRKADDAERGADEAQEHRKETFPDEALEGQPGYGEAPAEVRKDQLPDQGWK